jgi:hypothetical protein
MEVGKGVAIAALVIAIVGGILPAIGLYVGWIALLLACVSALLGEKGLTIATMVVSAIMFVFLTPSLWLSQGAISLGHAGMEAGDKLPPFSPFLAISLVLLLAPAVCMFLRASGRLTLGAGKTRGPVS